MACRSSKQIKAYFADAKSLPQSLCKLVAGETDLHLKEEDVTTYLDQVRSRSFEWFLLTD